MAELTLPTTPEATTPQPPTPTPPVAPLWSEEVQRFATTHGLTDYLPHAIRIVEESFPPGSEVRPRMQWSPEDGSSRLILDVLVPCSVKEASERYQQLLDRWIREVPIHVRTHATVTICPV